jgi:hypothetical protein
VYTSGTVIGKNVALKASWTATEPAKVEKITSLNNVAGPVYQFNVPDGVTWDDIQSVTYTLYVSDAGTLTTEVRQYVVGAILEGSFPITGAYVNSSWGQIRIVYQDSANMGALLASGKNSAGQAGGKDEWVKITKDVVPIASSYGTGTSGITVVGPGITVSTYYMAVVGGTRAGNAALQYYIKDVALVKTDGTLLPSTPFWDENGYFDGDGSPGDPAAPALPNGALLKDLSFASTSGSNIIREMAYAPD